MEESGFCMGITCLWRMMLTDSSKTKPNQCLLTLTRHRVVLLACAMAVVVGSGLVIANIVSPSKDRLQPEVKLLRTAEKFHLKAEYAKELEACREALALNPKFYEAMIQSGMAAASMQQYKLAISFFNDALSIQSNSAPALQGRGEARLSSKDYAGAISDFTAALKTDPLADVHGWRGAAWQRSGDQKNAIKDFDEALKKHPNSFIYASRALSFYFLKKSDKALDDAMAALKIRPDYLPAHKIAFTVYVEQNKFREALNVGNEIVEIAPRDASAFNNRGYVFYMLNMLEPALHDLNHAIELNSGFAESYSSRADVQSALGKVPEALADYNQALKLSPTNASALQGKQFLQSHPKGGRPPRTKLVETVGGF